MSSFFPACFSKGVTMVALSLSIFLLGACAEQTPLRIGFVGGITGRVADLGINGRNGAILALEQRNAAGGIDGRKLELLVRDDEQNPDTARRVVKELIDSKVEAIVGPMTSAMAEAAMPLQEQAKILMISPTATAESLSSRDDHFFRVISSTKVYAEKSADYQFDTLGRRRIAAVFDKSNQAFATSWLNDFWTRFDARGGRFLRTLEFTSSANAPFAEVARTLVEADPDAILIIANSVDTAMLAQQIRRYSAKVPMLAAEWSATERLIELGGRAVEGMIVGQFLNRESREANYREFRAAYMARFNQEPGFAGVAGYDAMKVILDALAGKPKLQPLKQRILEMQHFDGASGTIAFSPTGDALRQTYITAIRDGVFVTLE